MDEGEEADKLSVIFPSYREIWELPAWTYLTWDRQKWMLLSAAHLSPRGRWVFLR